MDLSSSSGQAPPPTTPLCQNPLDSLVKTGDIHGLALKWASGTYQHDNWQGCSLGALQMFALVKKKGVCGGEREAQTGKRPGSRLGG